MVLVYLFSILIILWMEILPSKQVSNLILESLELTLDLVQIYVSFFNYKAVRNSDSIHIQHTINTCSFHVQLIFNSCLAQNQFVFNSCSTTPVN